MKTYLYLVVALVLIFAHSLSRAQGQDVQSRLGEINAAQTCDKVYCYYTCDGRQGEFVRSGYDGGMCLNGGGFLDKLNAGLSIGIKGSCDEVKQKQAQDGFACTFHNVPYGEFRNLFGAKTSNRRASGKVLYTPEEAETVLRESQKVFSNGREHEVGSGL